MAAKSPTQKYLDFQEIREDVVVLKDGSLRAVILCSSINFALKSEEEQNALIYGYMEFLNSLDHSMQIVIQSRKLDVEDYLRRLREAQKKQTNELLKIQIGGYLDYVRELIEIGEIMTKKFFIIVPYNPLGDKTKNFWTRLVETFRSVQSISLNKQRLQKYKIELGLRVDNIQGRLKSLGLESVMLDTQGLIELYYNSYNPITSESQKLKDVSLLNIET